MTYQMDSTVHLVQELDGVRIIGNETHELLQRVPGKWHDVFSDRGGGALQYICYIGMCCCEG